MDFAFFDFTQCWLYSRRHSVQKRLRQWVRPDSDSLAGGTALNLTRSKSELVLENALLRQQLIVLHPRSIEGTTTVCTPPSSLPRHRFAMVHEVVLPCSFHSDAAQSDPIRHPFPASLTIPKGAGRVDSLLLRRTRPFGQDSPHRWPRCPAAVRGSTTNRR